MNLHFSPFGLLLLQIVVILSFAKSLGLLLRWFGQSAVVVEILAGVILGPSVVGLLFPSVSAFLFPPGSLPSLALLSQLGLVLYLFVVGMRLDASIVRQRVGAVALITLTSIFIPFLLGLLAAWMLARSGDVGLSLPFALFLGTALCVTAFPVLARIISERGLSTSPVAQLSLTCAAIGDVVAWCMLAITVAISSHGSVIAAAGTVVAAAAFTVAMLVVVRPLLARLLLYRWPQHRNSKVWMAGVLVYLLLAALTTEMIGVHALYGAFIAGIAMPVNAEVRATICERLESVSEAVLLPLFFALSGLRTRIGALDHGGMWACCGIIVMLAMIGKGAGGMTARLCGMSWRDSIAAGRAAEYARIDGADRIEYRI